MILLAQATSSSGQSDQDTKGSTAMTMKDDLTHREKDKAEKVNASYLSRILRL